MNELTILYVEDDQESREIMQILVMDVMGLPAPTIFKDSHDFVNHVAQLATIPDVVLLDIHVSPFNGFEMLDMLRALPAYEHVPVVALTASVMNEEIDQLQEAGFDGVVAKPINADTFPQLLSQALNGQAIWNVID